MNADSSEIDVIAYSIKDAVRVSSLSRTTLFRLAKLGKLDVRQIGSRRLIMADSLRKVLDEQAARVGPEYESQEAA